MEKWLLDNAFEIALLVFGGVFGYVKLGNYAVQISKDLKRIDADLSNHYKDPAPHRSCAVEQERYKNICDHLAEIKGKLDTLDKRVVAILANRPIEETDERETG